MTKVLERKMKCKILKCDNEAEFEGYCRECSDLKYSDYWRIKGIEYEELKEQGK
jgi:hypothetical protein